MSIHFTEDSYEQSLLATFGEMSYETECGYDIERDHRNPLYDYYLRRSLARLNPELSADDVESVVCMLKDIDGATLIQRNETFMNWLQNGLPVEIQKDGEVKTINAQLVDFDNIENNDFRVVNQWTVEEYATKRCDVVVFINGLPLVVIELKSPTNESVGENDAYNQIKNYQQVIPSLFVYNCFNVISDMLTSKVGTLTSDYERYVDWKSKDGDYDTTAVADYHTFFEGIFNRKHLIELVQDYICFDKNDGTTRKILAGYHQFFAVRKSMQRTYKAINGDRKIGVFWHTQGSGKSLSMVFYAHQLIRKLPEVTIVVVTDRKDLDQQLYGQFARCSDFVRIKPSNADSREGLIKLLKDRKSGGVIFTTIQKFEEGEGPLSDRRNIIVMSDEAHRSQYGDETWDLKEQKMKIGMARKMREALPNASFIGFTGTPVSDRDRDTTEVFGDYIDKYDMTQSVADGSTRPIYYESRVVKLDLNGEVMEKIDKEFDELVDLGATDEQVMKAKKDLSRLEEVLGSDECIDSLVRDIISHYENYRADILTGKAMIVALSRTVGIKIYKKMIQLRPDWTEKVKVVMTGSNKDPEDWHSIIGNEQYKKELAKRFKDNDDPMKIAIVRDMWLTGFDVPSLATMYVFKAMSGHNLMQAIARVNRVFPGKEGGLIVDYIGIAQELRTAMHNYTKRDQKKFGNPDIAKTALVKFKMELDICKDQIYGFDYKKFFGDSDADKAQTLVNALNFMVVPSRDQRKKDLVEHSQLLHNAETLCRSKLSTKQRHEVAFFDALRAMINRLSSNGNGSVTRAEINHRLAELLKQSIKSEGVQNLFSEKKTEFSLFDESFMKEIQAMKEKNLAVELLKKLLKDKIHTFKRTNVVQSEKFSSMLTDSLNKYVKGLLTNEEVIQELIGLAHSITQQEAEGNNLGLTVEEKAFYDALSKPEGIKKAYSDEQFVTLTKELTEALRKNRTIDWNKKESSRAQMRVMIKRLLKKYKYPPEGFDEAIDTVMDQCNNWADNEDYDYEPVINVHRNVGYSMPDDEMMIAAEGLH